MNSIQINSIIAVLVFCFGAIIFSFLNVVIWRVPQHLSIVRGRSMCTQCGHVLRPRDLVPLVSFLLLKGRCRDCGARISPRYPLVELLGGSVAVLCLFYFGGSYYGLRYPGGSAVTAFCFLAVLTAVAFIDHDTMEIPDSLVIATLLLAVLAIFTIGGISWLDRAIGLLCVSLPMALLTLLIPGAFGGGDIKLMAAVGLLLGAKSTAVAFLIAVLLGGVHAAGLLLNKKIAGKAHIAFGPYLCLGSAAALFIGPRLVDWYLSLLV